MDGERPKPRQPGLFTRVMRRRYGHAADDFDVAEELDSGPGAGWVYGILAAGVVAGYGLICLIQQHGWILNLARGRHRGAFLVRVDGPAAFWYGWTLIGCGLLLHFHSFWGTHRTLSRYHEPAWYAALCGTLVAAALFAYHVVLRP